jgi:hypothetical protein
MEDLDKCNVTFNMRVDRFDMNAVNSALTFKIEHVTDRVSLFKGLATDGTFFSIFIASHETFHPTRVAAAKSARRRRGHIE